MGAYNVVLYHYLDGKQQVRFYKRAVHTGYKRSDSFLEHEKEERTEYEIKRSKGIPVKIPTLKKGEPANIVWKSIKLANDTFEKYGEYRDILLE